MASVVTAHEFDTLVSGREGAVVGAGVRAVSHEAFQWLEAQCFRGDDGGQAVWVRPARWRGRRALQLTSFVGVVQAPDGTRIEVLPKVSKAIGGGDAEARSLLIGMLRCLPGFRHVRTHDADLLAIRMPLPEVFIAEFLYSVQAIVKRGLRGDYVQRQSNLHALRGKLLVAHQLRENLLRVDRFFSAHDAFSSDRAENRLLHGALQRVLKQSSSRENQRLARELAFVFADVPPSGDPAADFARVRRERGMGYYADALAWAQLILCGLSPTAGIGTHVAPSLMFPMDALFEAFVAAHLSRQLPAPLGLSAQACSEHLVTHRQERWFRLRPDLLVQHAHERRMVLDTKWKLLDAVLGNASKRYGLSEADFYQLHAYGHGYLKGRGELALVYPLTDAFNEPLEFGFLHSPGLRLWVLPFCLAKAELRLPDGLMPNLAHAS